MICFLLKITSMNQVLLIGLDATPTPSSRIWQKLNKCTNDASWSLGFVIPVFCIISICNAFFNIQIYKVGLQIPRIQKAGLENKYRQPARIICPLEYGLYIREDGLWNLYFLLIY